MFLRYEDMWDMPIDPAEERGGASAENGREGKGLKRITHWAGNIIYAVVFAAFKLAFRLRVIGIDRLRAAASRGGCLVVSNHASYLDPAFLWIAARPHPWVRFMAREDMFSNAGGFAGQIISRVGAFPIKRASADRISIKRASAMLKRGESVGIFPEGTRRGRGSADPELHGGAAFIARMGRAPMIPATVRNVDRIKRKGQRLRFPRITVVFGDPVYLEDFDFLPKEDRLDGATWYVMRECYALLRDVDREQVDMGELFAGARDFSEAFAGRDMARKTEGE